VDIHFQLAPGVAKFDYESLSVYSKFDKGWNVFVQTQKQYGLDLTEEEGWVSFEYTKKEPRPAFRYRINKQKGDQKIQFVTVVAPYEKDIPKVEINMKKDSRIIQLKIDGKIKIIEYAL
jgi:heparan-sulfate lyase